MHLSPISRCRVCRGEKLVRILDLGEQALTGRFARAGEPPVPRGPLLLVRCDAAGGCGLVQLAHDYHGADMYGPRYGYRSSVTSMMVRHLTGKARALAQRVGLRAGDAVLDIGCNDGTLLRGYDGLGVARVGIDPSSGQFAAQFPSNAELIVDFFSAARVRRARADARFRVVTSMAMFYDVGDPLQFMREVAGLLADDGVWEIEQAYLPATVRQLCYDAICHEHVTYYALHQMAWLAQRAGLEIVEGGVNEVNGGSFWVRLAHPGAYRPHRSLAALLAEEAQGGYLTGPPYERFAMRVGEHRDQVRGFFESARRAGKRVLGYGASTKGNVLLQYCALTKQDLPAILERDPRKYDLLTPGTGIPIIPEAEGRARRPDYLFVLPWHFRDEIVPREAAYLAAGGKLVFPLPRFEIVGA